MGKHNQVIPKAGLQPVPAFNEPFSMIIINCLGPLPKTKSGNEYLLTIICLSTRFPKAIPLRNIKTKTLVKFFTFVSLPKSVQSDQVQVLYLVSSSKYCMNWELNNIDYIILKVKVPFTDFTRP